MRYFLLCALFGYAAAIEMFGRDQSSAVRGRLMCDGRPAVGVKVKLWDVDRSKKFIFADLFTCMSFLKKS
ncbi:hypothetical protein ANCDUO_16577, partial [Ancylostoma duodenale]